METPPPIPAVSDVPASAGSRPAIRQGRSARSIILITLGILVGGCGLAVATTAWWVKRNIYASPIQPVSLTQPEQTALDAKLQVLETTGTPASLPAASPGEQERTLVITAKEINAYLSAQNLGEFVQVDLGHDKIAATVLVPVPADAGIPLISGTTTRFAASITARIDAEKKVVLEVNDVRVGGIPMPNAWLGDIKGLNLASENLNSDPALKRFLAGIQSLKITPAGVHIVLAE